MKTVIEMAREAGFPFNKYGLLQGDDDNEIDADAMLERFAELVRADEREACAKVCYELPWKDMGHIPSNLAFAAAIRARSNT